MTDERKLVRTDWFVQKMEVDDRLKIWSGPWLSEERAREIAEIAASKMPGVNFYISKGELYWREVDDPWTQTRVLRVWGEEDIGPIAA